MGGVLSWSDEDGAQYEDSDIERENERQREQRMQFLQTLNNFGREKDSKYSESQPVIAESAV
jgi:hypothetical protein